MEISNSLSSAASGTDALKVETGIRLLSNVLDSQTAQAAALFQGFSNAQPAPHPFLGKILDIRV